MKYFLIIVIPGAVIMGLGSMIFMVPHFTAEPNLMTAANNSSSDNICRGVSLREQDMGLGESLMNCETTNNVTCRDVNFVVHLLKEYKF